MQEHNIINSELHPLHSDDYRSSCKAQLDRDGVLVLENFLTPAAVKEMVGEGEALVGDAYFTANDHNVYLSPADADFPSDHPRNRLVTSSKGCITHDQFPENSPLCRLYASQELQSFLSAVLDEKALHEYADPLSSVNLHYASAGQELGWHFDNSSFAITLMVQAPKQAGVFEYVKDVRDADAGDMNYDSVADVLDGRVVAETLSMPAGTLVLFRGRNSMHRVTPVEGDTTRMLAVLAYNNKPGVALSESARKTFYGRLG